MRTVLLTENYRSVQPVLDVSRILIDRNEERLVSHLEGLSKVLISRGEEVRDLTQLPVIRAYDSKVQEEAGVLMEIEKLLESGTDPAEIAVIYYRHAQADQLIRLMGRKQLPYALRKQLNSLDVPLVDRSCRSWSMQAKNTGSRTVQNTCFLKCCISHSLVSTDTTFCLWLLICRVKGPITTGVR